MASTSPRIFQRSWMQQWSCRSFGVASWVWCWQSSDIIDTNCSAQKFIATLTTPKFCCATCGSKSSHSSPKSASSSRSWLRSELCFISACERDFTNKEETFKVHVRHKSLNRYCGWSTRNKELKAFDILNLRSLLIASTWNATHCQGSREKTKIKLRQWQC